MNYDELIDEWLESITGREQLKDLYAVGTNPYNLWMKSSPDTSLGYNLDREGLERKIKAITGVDSSKYTMVQNVMIWEFEWITTNS